MAAATTARLELHDPLPKVNAPAPVLSPCAWDTRLDREVALKVLRRREAPDAPHVIEEARLLARVRHPNAISVHGADCIDGRTGIWMEFIEGHQAVERLLRDALRLDPDFASAHILIAWTIHNQSRSSDEYLRHAAAAEAVADTTPEIERQFIIGSAHSLRAQAAKDRRVAEAERVKAIEAYESVLLLKPDHWWALSNVLNEYARLQRQVEGTQIVAKLAELRPNSFTSNAMAAETLFVQGNIDLGVHYAKRAAAVMTPMDRQQHSRLSAWLQVLPAKTAWLAADPNAAVSHLDALVSALPQVSGEERTAVAALCVPLYATLGQIRRAEALLPLLEKRPWLTRRDIMRAGLLSQRGDHAAARDFMLKYPPASESGVEIGTLWVEAGLLGEARKLIAYMETPQRFHPSFIALVQAYLSVAEHRFEDAIAHGQRSIDLNTGTSYNRHFVMAATQMADAWRATGQLQRGIDVLETYTSHRAEAFNDGWAGVRWTAARAKLGGFYRAAGRNADARKVEDEVLRLLAAADADYPLLVELQRRAR